jgi:hypothetical protein
MNKPHSINKKILMKWTLLGLSFVILISLSYWGIKSYKKHEQNTRYSEASQLAVKGKYNEAVKPMLKVYNSQTNAEDRAGTARQIGLYYYYAKDYENGRGWMSKASQLYKSVGNDTMAQSVNNESYMLYSLKNIKGADVSGKQQGM